MLSDAEKDEFAARVEHIVRTGDFVDASLGTMIGGMFFQSGTPAILTYRNLDEGVTVTGSYTSKRIIWAHVWINIGAGKFKVYDVKDERAWASDPAHQEHVARVLSGMRRYMVLEDLADV